MPTGQGLRGPAPVRELLERLPRRPLPPPADRTRELPGGAGRTTRGRGGPARRRLCVRLQEHRASRRASTTSPWRACASRWRRTASRWPRCTAPPAEVGQGVAGVQRRSRARSSASSGWRAAPDTRVGSPARVLGVAPDLRDRRRGGGSPARRCARRSPPAAERRRARKSSRPLLGGRASVEATRELPPRPDERWTSAGRARCTPASRSSPTARSSMSTSSSASPAWSSSRARRTSAARSTRWRSRASSRAAACRASGSR